MACRGERPDVSTATGKPAPTDPPAHEAINRYIDAAADVIDLSAEMRAALRDPAREVSVQIPVRMDNGTPFPPPC